MMAATCSRPAAWSSVPLIVLSVRAMKRKVRLLEPAPTIMS